MIDLLVGDTRSLLFLIAISAFLFGSIFLLVISFRPRQLLQEIDYVPVRYRGHLGRIREDLKKKNPLYRIMLPLISFLGFLIDKIPMKNLKKKLDKKLIMAGNPGAFSPSEYMAVVIIVTVAVPTAVYFIMLMLFGKAHPIAIFAACLLGFMYTIMWLSDAVTKRSRSINRSLPYTLDLLTLSIEAGLDFIAAVERIVTKKKERGPLTEELFQMLQELKMGKTRREALRDMSARVNLENLNSVVSALIQADQLGSSLGPVLRIQSEMLRLRRSQRAEKLAMEAPVKMTFPLLLIFTSVFLLLFGPIIIKFIRGGIF